jgi:N-acetylmuramoyl-L-alanine amidase
MVPANTSSPLANADRAALAYSDYQAVRATAAPCPYSSAEVRKVIEVRVVGEDGMGVAGIALILARPDGQALTGKTGPGGAYGFRGLAPGSYQLSLPELDTDAWLVTSTQPLADAAAHCADTAAWRSVAGPAVAGEQVHIVKRGECVSKLVEQHGFFADTIWDHPSNATLRRRRRDNMHILYPDDRLVIPARRQRALAVATGDQVILRRRGVPGRVRIRFVQFDETPRAGVPYLLSVTTGDGVPVADIASKIDEAGFIDQLVPPNTVHATVTLHPGPWAEVHDFDIGVTNPIDTIAGWQARLNNLDYDCGAADNQAGPRTQAAIRAFQRAKQLPETGDMDAPTKAALLRTALS